jgi:hypothetical protein
LKNELPLSDHKLTAYEAKRDLAAELLQAVCEMKAGQVKAVVPPVGEQDKPAEDQRDSEQKRFMK